MTFPTDKPSAPLTALLAALVLLLAVAAPAQAKQIRVPQGAFGTAAQPSFGNPQVIATDPATGDLLVFDISNDTISRFHPDGTPDDFSALGTNVIDGAGGGDCATVAASCDQTPQNGLLDDGQFTYLGVQIAIDRSGTATDGDIYINQLFNGNKLIDVFAADGHYLGQLTAAGATAFSSPDGVAVDAAGALYVSNSVGTGAPTAVSNAVIKFDPSANPPLNSDFTPPIFPFTQPASIAAGAGPSAGSLFLEYSGSTERLAKVDATTGALDYVIDPDPEGSGTGASLSPAVNPSNGHLFAAKNVSTAGIHLVTEYDASGASPAARLHHHRRRSPRQRRLHRPLRPALRRSPAVPRSLGLRPAGPRPRPHHRGGDDHRP